MPEINIEHGGLIPLFSVQRRLAVDSLTIGLLTSDNNKDPVCLPTFTIPLMHIDQWAVRILAPNINPTRRTFEGIEVSSELVELVEDLSNYYQTKNFTTLDFKSTLANFVSSNPTIEQISMVKAETEKYKSKDYGVEYLLHGVAIAIHENFNNSQIEDFISKLWEFEMSSNKRKGKMTFIAEYFNLL